MLLSQTMQDRGISPRDCAGEPVSLSSLGGKGQFGGMPRPETAGAITGQMSKPGRRGPRSRLCPGGTPFLAPREEFRSRVTLRGWVLAAPRKTHRRSCSSPSASTAARCLSMLQEAAQYVRLRIAGHIRRAALITRLDSNPTKADWELWSWDLDIRLSRR